MESGIQSSFIPHDAAVPQASPRYSSGGGLAELVLLFAIVLLVASGALAGAVFLYSQYVHSSAASKLDQLKRAEGAFEPSLIQQLTRLDDRMTAGEQILTNHIAPTELFAALQATTLSTVSYQTLDFEAEDAQHMQLKMTGVAEGVNSIALQADLMSKSGVFTSPIFSDISRQNDGVHFSVAALINPASLSYVRLIQSEQASSGASQSASVAQSLFGGQAQPQSPQSQTQTQPQTQPQPQPQTASTSAPQSQSAPAQGSGASSGQQASPFEGGQATQ